MMAKTLAAALARFTFKKLSNIALTKAWSNGVSVGGYYTGTNTDSALYKAGNDGLNIGKDYLTAFVQKTF